MTEFRIPLRPEDLQSANSDHAFSISSDLRFSIDLAESKTQQFQFISPVLSGVIHDLGFNEPLSILDQNQFEEVFIVISEFRHLMDGEFKTGLLEALASNLKLLCTSIETKLINEEEEEALTECRRIEMRSGVKIYVFLLKWLWMQIMTTGGDPSSFTPRRQRRTSTRVRKSVVLGDDIFDWRPSFDKTLLSFSTVLSLDLNQLWTPSKVDQRILELLLSFTQSCLASGGDLIRRQATKSSLYKVIGLLAVRHGLLQETVSSLVIEAHKTEGLGPILAELILQTQEQLGNDELLGAFVQELTKTSPKDWSVQWDATKGRSSSIKSISKLIEALGDILADCMVRYSAALEPYWSCSAHPIRSALLCLTGAMVQALDHPNGRDQQRKMLDRLMQRFLDINAFTRAKCVSIWVTLTQKGCVPMDYWLELTKMAIDRLQDTTSIVKKSSIALIQALVEYNPFGENLNKDRYQVTLDAYKAKLQDCPMDQRDHEEHQKNLFLVQNLETAVQFIALVEEALESSALLLNSSSINVVQETIQLAVACKQFSVKDSDYVMRSSFVLVYSQEATLRDQIIEAFLELYMDDEDELKTAQNIVSLAIDVSIGELTCLEEIVKYLLSKEKLKNQVVKAFIFIGLDRDGMNIPKEAKVQAAAFLLSVCGPYCPELLIDQLDALLLIAFEDSLTNGPAVSYICSALKNLGNLLDEDSKRRVCCSLVQILFEEHMSQASWFQVTESAVGALYSIFSQPMELFEEILEEMARVLSAQPLHPNSTIFLRFCFLLGVVSIHHMRYVDICVEILKTKLTSNRNERSEDGEIDNPMGTEFSRQELELENLKTATEREMVSGENLIGFYSFMISSICQNVVMFVELPVPLQLALSFTLVKLMTIDHGFCNQHLQLLFTFLYHEKVAMTVRENLIISLTDLIMRFPNLMEPWTPKIHDLLSSKHLTIQKSALLVLTHLILSDMIKVQGHISKIVILMRESNERIHTMTKSFINELHKKSTKTSNPIYNFFPDILSNFQLDQSLDTKDFQMIIQYLLKFTNERQGEKLVEKLCLRFESKDTPKFWRTLSFSIRCLQLGERGIQRLRDFMGSYRHSLGDSVVFRHFKETLVKLRRGLKGNELKSFLNEFEGELTSIHEGLKTDDMETEEEEEEAVIDRPLDTESVYDESLEHEGSVSDRKRKTLERDDQERRSEIRLLGGSSRLDRIPEQGGSRDQRSLSFGNMIPPSSSPLIIEEVKRNTTGETREVSELDMEVDGETTNENSGVERRLSRLSISQEID
eukprot:g5288.t1